MSASIQSPCSSWRFLGAFLFSHTLLMPVFYIKGTLRQDAVFRLINQLGVPLTDWYSCFSLKLHSFWFGGFGISTWVCQLVIAASYPLCLPDKTTLTTSSHFFMYAFFSTGASVHQGKRSERFEVLVWAGIESWSSVDTLSQSPRYISQAPSSPHHHYVIALE